jgi:hypothetical protein
MPRARRRRRPRPRKPRPSRRRLEGVYRISIYVGGERDEVTALQDRIARLLHRRSGAAPARHGYVVALTAVPEPEDDDAFVALVTDGADRILLGPPEILW